jgi:ATP/maltotriose-dependent transcriptional regulator MalT
MRAHIVDTVMSSNAQLADTADGPFNDTERAAVLVGFLAIMRGYSNRDIGHELGMSGETVKLHLKHIFRKLDVRSRAQAVARAQGHGGLVAGTRAVLHSVRELF